MTTLPTLASLAAFLGELEAPGSDDLTATHFARWDVMEAAAERLPVQDPADAALAVSFAVVALNRVDACELTEDDRGREIAAVARMLAQVARWLAVEHGAQPLRTIWTGTAEQIIGITAGDAP